MACRLRGEYHHSLSDPPKSPTISVPYLSPTLYFPHIPHFLSLLPADCSGRYKMCGNIPASAVTRASFFQVPSGHCGHWLHRKLFQLGPCPWEPAGTFRQRPLARSEGDATGGRDNAEGWGARVFIQVNAHGKLRPSSFITWGSRGGVSPPGLVFRGTPYQGKPRIPMFSSC